MRYAGRSLNVVTLLACLGLVACSDQTSPDATPHPATLDIVSGNQQYGSPGAMLADPLVVRVVTSTGTPVSGQVVNFVVTSGGGKVFAGTAITRADGLAKERWTLGTNTAAAQRVEARAVDTETGNPLVFASFTAQFGTAPAPVATVEVTPSTASVPVGGTTQLTA